MSGASRTGRTSTPCASSRSVISVLSSAIPRPPAAASIAIWLRSKSTLRHRVGGSTPARANQRGHCACDLTEWIKRRARKIRLERDFPRWHRSGRRQARILPPPNPPQTARAIVRRRAVSRRPPTPGRSPSARWCHPDAPPGQNEDQSGSRDAAAAIWPIGSALRARSSAISERNPRIWSVASVIRSI